MLQMSSKTLCFLLFILVSPAITVRDVLAKRKYLFSIGIMIGFTLLSALNGCATSFRQENITNFTQENILKLRPGMSSEEVIAIFGMPIKTEAATCGQAFGKPWLCITWYYDRTDFLYAKRLTFHEGENQRLYLNSWQMP